jgi:hypothetical protein
MRARIEQIGKNTPARLKAAGASSSDIILSAYVTDPDGFNKKADLRARDLGPKSPRRRSAEAVG